MDYYSYLKWGKNYLTIKGPLSDSDAKKLENVLILPLFKYNSLKLNIDDVTSISCGCMNIITRAIRIAQQKNKQLLLDTRYNKDAMIQWIQYVYNQPANNSDPQQHTTH